MSACLGNSFPIWDKPSQKGQLGGLSYELIAPSLAFMTCPRMLSHLSKGCLSNNGSYRSTCLSHSLYHERLTCPRGAAKLQK